MQKTEHDPASDGIHIEIDDSEAPDDFVGEFPSIDSFLRNRLEELVHPAAHWLLEHIDFVAVRQRFEAEGCRYECVAGRVYCRTLVR